MSDVCQFRDTLVSVANSNISGLTENCRSIDMVLLASATRELTRTVNNFAHYSNTAQLVSLMDNCIPNGHLVYNCDIRAPLIRYNGTWITLDGRTFCQPNTSLWGWGLGTLGRLGDGTTISKSSPVREVSSSTDWCDVSKGNDVTLAVKRSGQIWGFGTQGTAGPLGAGNTNDFSSPVREISLSTNWCQVSNMCRSTAAIKNTGQLWVWGLNTQGKLGDGTNTDRLSPVREASSSTDWCQVSIGFRATGAVKTSGQIWTWGNGGEGTLGTGTTTDRSSPGREFCSATDWCLVSSGFNHMVALKNTGQLWAWGTNNCGQLGRNIATKINTTSPVREITSSSDWCVARASADQDNAHSAGIKTSGQLWIWGNNTSGQLGDGTTATKCSPVQEVSSSTDWCQVSLGVSFSAAVKTTGQIWGWGVNSNGQLGDGTTVSKSSPVREVSSSTNWCKVSSGDFGTSGLRNNL